MKDYTNNAPVFSESIQITETSDPAHADIINKAPIQIFQNTLYNCKSIEKLERNAGNAEAHNTETEYQKGDYCTNDGSTYKCMQPTQGEWDSACWEKINLLSEISDLQTPEFDDSGTAAGITGFPAFLQKVKSKMNIFEFYRNFKAGMQYVLHTGQIVNNCTSEAENLALAAAQGKVLWDRQTQLISDLSLSLSTDILAYALSDSCKIGFSSGAFIGQNYTGELPDGDLKYGTWEINKRTNNTITVKAFTPYKSTMWINSYVNTAGWAGWTYCANGNDLFLVPEGNFLDFINSKKQGFYGGIYTNKTTNVPGTSQYGTFYAIVMDEPSATVLAFSLDKNAYINFRTEGIWNRWKKITVETA